MIECFFCEDWFHAECIKKKFPYIPLHILYPPEEEEENEEKEDQKNEEQNNLSENLGENFGEKIFVHSPSKSESLFDFVCDCCSTKYSSFLNNFSSFFVGKDLLQKQILPEKICFSSRIFIFYYLLFILFKFFIFIFHFSIFFFYFNFFFLIKKMEKKKTS